VLEYEVCEGHRMNRTILSVAAMAVLVLALPASSAAETVIPRPYPAEGDPAPRAAASKKKKPCRNVKSNRSILCKPRVGTWSGVVVQQTPSGPEPSLLTFTVERKGATNNGTDIDSTQFGPRWWNGDTSYVHVGGGEIAPSSTCPSCPPYVAEPGIFDGSVDKFTGQFAMRSTIINESGAREEFSFFGDFINRRRAKGTIRGSRSSTDGSSFDLRVVTWTASPGA
jgi:hypothetical protein